MASVEKVSEHFLGPTQPPMAKARWALLPLPNILYFYLGQ